MFHTTNQKNTFSMSSAAERQDTNHPTVTSACESRMTITGNLGEQMPHLKIGTDSSNDPKKKNTTNPIQK
jgi:hypothetical protein